MIKDYFLLVYKNFLRRRLRGMLTILGIFIGIMAVVALISLTQGMQNAISSQFEKLGSNRITVTAGGMSLGPVGTELTSAKLSEKDIRVIEKVPGVDSVFGILMENARIDYNKEVKYEYIFAVPTDPDTTKLVNSMSIFEIEKGRSIGNSDRFKADIGNKIASDVFKRDVKVGSTIKINGQDFGVAGTRKVAGTGIHDFVIKIPMDTARVLFDEPDKLSMIMVIASENANATQIADRIKKDLRKERDVKEGEEDFTVQTSEQAIAIFNQILSVVQIILVGIAAVSLVVGGVGIMNTMYTSVWERTREIGIMKAVGAKSSQIRNLFLIESGTIGLIGGVIGVVLGIAISKVAQIIANSYGVALIPAISLWLIIAALAFAFFVGGVSGVFPAIQASRLKPIVAIRRY